MVSEQMSAREAVAGSSLLSNIMKASNVGIRSTTQGLTLAAKSHPNSIKTLIPITIDIGSVGHSKLVPFIIALAWIMPTTTRTSSTIATTT